MYWLFLANIVTVQFPVHFIRNPDERIPMFGNKATISKNYRTEQKFYFRLKYTSSSSLQHKVGSFFSPFFEVGAYKRL